MPRSDPALCGAELAWAVLEEIREHPERHNQGYYARETLCGTTYCVAGHAVRIAYPGARFLLDHWDPGPLDEEEDRWALRVDLPGARPALGIHELAQQLLHVDVYTASRLFSPDRDREMLLDELQTLAQDFACSEHCPKAVPSSLR